LPLDAGMGGQLPDTRWFCPGDRRINILFFFIGFLLQIFMRKMPIPFCHRTVSSGRRTANNSHAARHV
jgi:hypothetical protein